MVAASRPPALRTRRSNSAASVRLLTSALLAWFLSAGLFWLLWVMTNQRQEHSVISAIPRIDFSRLKQDTELQEVKRVKPQIDKPEPPPASPTVSTAQSSDVSVGVDMAALAPPGVDFGGFGGGIATGGGGGAAAQLAFGAGSDRDAVPMVRLQPEYPESAQSRGIEGWVAFQFDVNTNGSTENIKILDARPTGVFEQSTVKAVMGWKYSPKVENGKPVARRGLKQLVKFEMPKGSR